MRARFSTGPALPCQDFLLPRGYLHPGAVPYKLEVILKFQFIGDPLARVRPILASVRNVFGDA
jgi:hypothetical protein